MMRESRLEDLGPMIKPVNRKERLAEKARARRRR